MSPKDRRLAVGDLGLCRGGSGRGGRVRVVPLALACCARGGPLRGCPATTAQNSRPVFVVDWRGGFRVLPRGNVAVGNIPGRVSVGQLTRKPRQPAAPPSEGRGG